MEHIVKNVQIRETQGLNDRGVLERTFRVSASTARGTVFSVDIPETEFTPAVVRERLDQRAGQLAEVEALGDSTEG